MIKSIGNGIDALFELKNISNTAYFIVIKTRNKVCLKGIALR